MKLYLTNGLFGEHIKQIGSDAENAKTILEYIFAWKNNLENQAKYKIEKYDRFLFKEDSIGIDFGDYSTFMLIEDVSNEQKKMLIGN